MALSTENAQVYSAVISLSSGAVTASLRLVTANRAWPAGTYRAPLTFTAPGLLGGNQISPATQDMNLVIPAFLRAPATLPATRLLVNDLNQFRQANGLSADIPFTLAHSVSVLPSVRAGAALFSFSTGSSYNRLPSANVSQAELSLDALPGAVPRLLSNADQALTSTALAVPVNDTRTITGKVKLSASSLRTGFIQAGTYSVPLTFTWDKPAAAYPTTQTMRQVSAGALEVLVSDMGELVANQNTVSLNFATPADFQSGVATDMPAHLRLSKTTPYSLYVRASAANFSSGSQTIPVNVVQIGPIAGETGMNTVTLSTTAQ